MRSRSNGHEWLRVSEEVEEALRRGLPIVALESTVLAHGLPRPRNLQVGLELEAIVRAGQCVPATVAVVDGVPTVGLAAAELERVATADGVAKLSTRDLPVAAGRGLTGATTVASTAHLAARAGIRVFATGGIGGVHRGLPPDISADLIELHRTSIIVVCAGAKSILDLPATRELLETFGILVIGWRTDSFPAFYFRETDQSVDARVEDAASVARIWRAHRNMELHGALLLCAPIPEGAEIRPGPELAAIERVLASARESGGHGREVTPRLLRMMGEATGGRTLDANIALLHNNARIAADVAVRLTEGDLEPSGPSFP